MSEDHIKRRKRWSAVFYIAAAVTLLCIIFTVARLQEAWQEETRLAKLLLSAINGSKTGLVQVNADMEIVGWSKSMEEMTGWRASDVLHTSLGNYVIRGYPENHDARAKAAFAKAREAGNTHRIMVVTAVLIGRHAERIQVRVRTYMVPDKDIIISLIDRAAAVEVHP